MLTGLTSTLSDGATAWMTANWLVPPPWVESRRTAARVMPGAICLSNSNHFPPMLYSVVMKPVALPPGRARLSMRPERLLYRKTGRTSAAKNFVDVDGGTTIKVGVMRPVRDQPSGIDVLLRDVDCGQPMTRRQLRDKASTFLRESVDADNEHVYML